MGEESTPTLSALTHACPCGAEFETADKLHGHIGGAHTRAIPPRKECDGTVADYRRHRDRGETACAESKRNWRTYNKNRRRKP